MMQRGPRVINTRLFIIISICVLTIVVVLYYLQTSYGHTIAHEKPMENDFHRRNHFYMKLDVIERSENASFDAAVSLMNEQVLIPKQSTFHHQKPKQNVIAVGKATTFSYDIEPLLEKLGNGWQWKFIRKRIETNWKELVERTKELTQQNLISESSTKRQILIYPGLLIGTDFAKRASEGTTGPLGELVQWADLIAGLYVLGHDIELQFDKTNVDMGLKHQLTKQTSSDPGCENKGIDYIYTDLLGHSKLSETVQKAYKKKFRILDHYGTEQAYNNVKYARRWGMDKHCGRWGLRGLHLKQIYTFYPQTPDNTFLGYMISNASLKRSDDDNKTIAYLYGKDPSYIKDRIEPSQILPILTKYVEVHSSFQPLPVKLRKYKIINHGHLSTQEYLELTQRTKLVIGLGKPEEGPGVLEAIANGCIYINPKRPPNWKYDGKPTNRTLTSQNPYAEKFIGPPHVFTVDYSKTKLLEQIIKAALRTKVKPFTPFELTPGGYIQRLYTLLQHQNFCDEHLPLWPPISSMQILLGNESKSCNEVCEDEGLVCENLHFNEINKLSIFIQQQIKCNEVVIEEELYAPSYLPNNSTCVLQKDKDLYSCASYNEATENISRLCPCRDFIKNQINMCSKC